MRMEDVIKRPIVLTEKGTVQRETQNKYTFEVARDANKIEIRKAVESLFSVSVVEVNTCIVRGKSKRMGRGYERTKNWKKAVVTLKSGESIEAFGGS